MSIDEVSDQTFETKVLRSRQPVLVDFWAPWCGPCRSVAAVLEALSAERDDLRIVKLNIDENPGVTAEYDVLSIPTQIVFQGGAEALRLQGALPRKRLEHELEPILV